MLVASRARRGPAPRSSRRRRSRSSTRRSEGDDLRKALSLWAALSAGGAAVGLLLGGVLTQALSWPWIFFVNVPIGVAAVALAVRFVPEAAARTPNREPTSSARSASPAGSRC